MNGKHDNKQDHSSYAEENNAVEENGTNEMLTLEYVCDEFQIDESEFADVDFERFVNYYNLSYETIHNENVEFLLEKYKENLEKIELPDYSLMYNYDKNMDFSSDMKNHITIVFFSSTEGDENNYIIYDFKINKVISGSGAELNITEKDIIGDADDTVKEKVLALFDQYDVYSWNREQDSSMSEVSGWYLGIQFEDGTIYGLNGNYEENEYSQCRDLFLEDLKDLAVSIEFTK